MRARLPLLVVSAVLLFAACSSPTSTSPPPPPPTDAGGRLVPATTENVTDASVAPDRDFGDGNRPAADPADLITDDDLLFADGAEESPYAALFSLVWPSGERAPIEERAARVFGGDREIVERALLQYDASRFDASDVGMFFNDPVEVPANHCDGLADVDTCIELRFTLQQGDFQPLSDALAVFATDDNGELHMDMSTFCMVAGLTGAVCAPGE